MATRRFQPRPRFYSPKYEPQQQPAQRADFRSTIYWNPAVQTDQKGEAQVEFFTSDAITNFRATLEGIGSQGQPGRSEQKFYVQKPLSIAVKGPASVISGETVLKLQIALSNNTNYTSGGIGRPFRRRNIFSLTRPSPGRGTWRKAFPGARRGPKSSPESKTSPPIPIGLQKQKIKLLA
ncbi:MAG: hypothetical protein IPJ82_13715 [Lewinellaceae bacterium]|nr:hypothetical protein [Lewinellaceae bacterium]